MKAAARAAVAGALLVLATAASAQNTGSPQKSIESASHGHSTYGLAGCGLGSMLFGNDNTIMSQVLASTTNGFGVQTFAITTGTSNCQPSSGAKGARLFIEANGEALAKDASRGSGETIVTLSKIVGCKDAAAVGVTLQKNFEHVFPAGQAAPEVVTENVLQTLRSEKSLSCSELG